MEREKALVIDDDQDFCSLVKLVLEQDGFETQYANNLAESLVKLSLLRPQLVLLDNNLPDGKGIDFFIRHKDLFQQAKVFMVSADPTYRLQEIAVKEGIIKFLTKPLVLREFRKIIHDSRL